MNDWVTYTEPSRKVCDLMKNAVGMQSIGRLINIAYWVMQTAHIPGDIVEMGVHEGRTATLMASLIDPTKKQIWLYDSFQGLPGPTKEDGVPEHHAYYKKGAMACDAKTALNLFGVYGLRMPILIPYFFKEVRKGDMPERVSFAHLDGDMYHSILPCLELVWPVLSVGGICIVDDTQHSELRGAAKAVSDFLGGTDDWISHPAWEPKGEKAIHTIIEKTA